MKKGPSCVVSLLGSAMNSRRGPTDGDQGSTRPPSLLFLQSQIPRRLCSSSERHRFKGGAIVKAPPSSSEDLLVATIWTMTLICIFFSWCPERDCPQLSYLNTGGWQLNIHRSKFSILSLFLLGHFQWSPFFFFFS